MFVRGWHVFTAKTAIQRSIQSCYTEHTVYGLAVAVQYQTV